MVEATQAAGLALTMASATVYAYVGRRLQDRQTRPEGALAWRLFVLWWYMLAATSALGAATTALAFAGITEYRVFVGTTIVSLVLVCIALWGLLFYLMYLFTGSRTPLPVLSVFYVVYFGLLVAFVLGQQPSGVELTRWSARLSYDDPMEGPLVSVVLVLLVVPQILGAIAYASLYFRVTEATQRYRIALVSSSIIVWFGSALVAGVSGIGQSDAWQVASRLIGFGASLLLLMAYLPPRILQRRLGVEALASHEPTTPSAPVQAAPVGA